MEAMKSLRRWLPLIGVFVLAGSTLLRALGHSDLAVLVEGAGGLAGAEAPPATAEVIAAAAALFGASIKLWNSLRETLEKE